MLSFYLLSSLLFISTFVNQNCKVPRENKIKTKDKLQSLLINFQSLRPKTADLDHVLSVYNPDIILGSEMWLSANICDAEIIPTGYTILRRGRESVCHHGGVLQAIRNNLIISRKVDFETQ